MAALRPIGRISASEMVRGELSERIRSGAYAVGEKLPSENELAREFGVSRPVVREALESLRAVGQIVSHSGRGSYVRSVSSEAGPLLLGRYSIRELHDVRSRLEVPGAGLAAAHRTDDQLAHAEELVDRLERCADPDEWVGLDVSFHVALAEMTGNRLQAHLVEILRAFMIEQSQAVGRVAGRLADANAEHRAILAAVAARDEACASEAMQTHLLSGQITWQRLLGSEPARRRKKTA
jgi:DNA-binding FadR family transcriptional regulator